MKQFTMRIQNQLKMLEVVSWCLIPNSYHDNLIGYEKHKEIILPDTETHSGMENIRCLITCDHTAQILGQGVEELEHTMYHLSPLKNHLLVLTLLWNVK